MKAMKNYLYLLMFFSSVLSAGEETLIKAVVHAKSQTYTGQPVYVDYQNLNIADDWALVYGELLAANKTSLNWSQVHSCDPNLDKGLWAILRKAHGAWQIIEHEACAMEPPYWYIDLDSNTWPCALFKDLMIAEGLTLEAQCRAKNSPNNVRIKPAVTLPYTP